MPRRFRILVVEDEAAIREAVCDQLAAGSFDVVEAGSGAEALARLEGVPPVDALFTDIRLGPGPDGWDVALAFRTARPDGPVVYASGYAPGEPRRVGNSLFFPKPYRPSKIAAALRIMLGPAATPPGSVAAVPGPPGSRLTRLTYMSRPTKRALEPSFSEAMARLSRQSQARNRLADLTGALIVSEGWFIQTIEGGHAPLIETLGRINQDPRHEDMRVFEIATTSTRLFESWAMHVGTQDAIDPELVWRCVESFRNPTPAAAAVLLEALTQSARLAA